MRLTRLLIVRKREVQLNADSAYLITPGVPDVYWDGFEKPVDESEMVIDTSGALNDALELRAMGVAEYNQRNRREVVPS